MPLLEDNIVNVAGPAGSMPVEDDYQTKERSFLLETVPAAFRLENSLGSLSSDDTQRRAPHNQNFNPFADIAGYETHANRFIDTNTPDEVASVKKQIDREKEDKRVLSESGWWGFAAQLAAGTLDPVNLIPVGGSAYRTYKIGGNVLGGATRAAKAGLLSSTAAETVLQSTQETRSLEDGAINIATATFLGGVLGGSTAFVREMVEQSAIQKNVAKAENTPELGTLRDTVEVRLGGLERELEKVFVTQGMGERTGLGATDAGIRSIRGELKTPLKPQGELDLKYNSGLTKVIWGHGSKSLESPAYQVVTGDLVNMPRIFRKYSPVEKVDGRTGDRTWEWIIERDTGSNPKKVKYVVKRLTKGNSGDHLVTVHVLREKKAKSTPHSITRKEAKKQKAPRSVDSPVMERSTSGIPPEGSPIPPKGVNDGRTPKDNIQQSPGNVTRDPFATEAEAWPELLERVEKDLAAGGEELTQELLDDQDINNIRASDGGSVGAASAIDKTSLEDEGLKPALGLEKILQFQDPILRLANSPSRIARKINEAIAEQPLLRNKNAQGIKSEVAVESLMKVDQAMLFRVLKSLDEAFLKYRTGNENTIAGRLRIGVADLAGKAEQEGMLTFAEFKGEVSRAMRRGDVHAIPEVAQVARTMRKELFDPLKDDAIKLGLLPEDVDVSTATSYVMRLWDHEKIVAKREDVKKIFTRYLVSEREKSVKRLEDGRERLLALENKTELSPEETKELVAINKTMEIDEYRAGFENQELYDRSGEIVDRILGTPDGRLPYDLSYNASRGGSKNHPDFRGPLKRRAFQIPDLMVEEFLENDIEQIARRYIRTMSGDVRMAQKFGKEWLRLTPDEMAANDLRLTGQLQELRTEYDRLKGQAKTEKERIDLDKRMKADIRDIAAIRDRVLGTYKMPSDPNSWIVRTGRIARNANYLRLLGGMTLSAIPDISRNVMVHGLSRAVGDGFIPFAKNSKSIKLLKEEVRLAGSATDMVLNSRAASLADITDDFGRHTKFERGLQAMSNNFGVVSLMAPWNDAMKQIAGLTTMRRMLDAIEASASGTIAPKEIEKLASQGIDAEMAKRIFKQFKAHGAIDGELKLPMTEKWTDREAIETLRAGLVKEVDRIIVTPGQDKPLWMSTEFGKLLGQFKSFGIASVQRTLLSGLQQRDMAALMGASLMVGLGAMTYGVKKTAAGKETSDDWRVWLAEGVDKSGLTGWAFDANNMLEKFTRGRLGVSALTGGPTMSRYASRSVAEALIGPSFGTVTNLATVTGAFATGEVRKQDVRALRQLLPYQNLFYIRRLFDEAEAGISARLGATQ